MSVDFEKLLSELEARMTANINKSISTSENKQMENVNNKFEQLETRLTALEAKSHSNLQSINANTIQIKTSLDLGKSNKVDVADLRTDLNELSENNLTLTTEVAELHKIVSDQAVKLRVHTELSENLANRSLKKNN